MVNLANYIKLAHNIKFQRYYAWQEFGLTYVKRQHIYHTTENIETGSYTRVTITIALRLGAFTVV